MQQILITGTNRGLGLEFVRQYLDRGDRVYATCRSPESATILQDLSKENSSLLTIIELEVTNENLLDKCVKVVESHTTHLDLLLNVAGVSPEGEDWDNLSVETMLETFHINSVAPLIIANRVHHLLNEAAEPKIVNLSSGQGSLHNKRSGGKYSYGSSKAALNMLTRAMAFDLNEDGIIVVVITPGWVRTDMGGPQAPLSPQESIRGAISVIDGLNLSDSGEFFTWEGERHPW